MANSSSNWSSSSSRLVKLPSVYFSLNYVANVLHMFGFSGLGIWYYRSRKNEIQPTENEDKQSKKNVTDVAASVSDDTQQSKKVNGIDKNTAKSPAAAVEEEDPSKQAQVYKNKGNKYFKEGKYSDSIKCYQQAIDICPKDNTDISVFHQNRAAAFEQLVTTS